MSPYDQQVYDAGFKYIPRSEFLLNPFQIPQGGGGGGATPGPGLPSINISSGGGGGGFNPYNPDMSQIRTDYSPYASRQYFAQPDSEVGIPSGMLADSKFMYGDQIQLPGILGMGQEFLKNVMPINQRAILENEARGAGIFTDDIGRVVAGPGSINTGANIMAGYNLNKVTPETIQKRRDTIIDKMSDRINPKTGKTFKQEKLDALDEFEKMYFGPTGVKTISTGIYKQRKDKKAAEAAAKAAKEEAERQEAERVAAFNKARADRAAARKSGLEEAIYTGKDTSGFDRPSSGAYAEGAGMGVGGGYASDYQGGGGSYSAPSSSVGYSAADNARESARGRYFMNGGLVDLVDIYD